MNLLKVDTIPELRDKLDEYYNGVARRQEQVLLDEAVGRYLAQPIIADIDLPPFRRSVVDGYAVLGADTFGVSDSQSVFLEIIGSVEMGKAPDFQVSSGQAVYVPTGGMLPDGADAMVMVEYTELINDRLVGINRPVAPNTQIMNQGEDLSAGVTLYQPGHRLKVRDIGVLAASGYEKIAVFQQPRLTIFSTGDELVSPAVRPIDCQIRDINTSALSAFARAAGATVVRQAILPDQYEICREAILDAITDSDIVVLSGGSSAGLKDRTAEIIRSIGQPGVITHGLAIKPGKPTIVGVFTDRRNSLDQAAPPKLVVGLPGHPLSAIIVYDVIVNRFLKQYFLGNHEFPESAIARMTENVHGGQGRETYQLVTLTRLPDGHQEAAPIRAKSGAIAQLMQADGYVIIEENTEGLVKGQEVEVIRIERGY